VKRLLFVDDEPRILQGLRQSLRSQRKVWEMEFVESGDAALQRLAGARFDVVVTDMRMPTMDGAELLSRVRTLQPDALRLVLSGQMDDRTAARAAASAHRFLAKPCETAALVAHLSRALELRDQLCSDELRACIGGMAGLPSLPSHCAELSSALRDESVNLKQVSRIVEGDVGMTVKVLQLVNSAFFGLPRQITSIEQAILQLGLGALHSLVIANALFEELTGGDVELLRDEEARSLLAARYARCFNLERRQADAAIASAMLHNVGRLALMSRMPEEYRANREHARAHATTLDQAEKARLGVTHAAIGAYLLGLWGLPFEVIQAVGSQNAAVDTFATLDAGAVVYLTKGLVAERLPTHVEEGVPLPSDLLSRLGVAHVVAQIREEIAAAPLPEPAAS
jgi:HD-like signal output (HDOD) protein/CheY-like chemotaxis protein